MTTQFVYLASGNAPVVQTTDDINSRPTYDNPPLYIVPSNLPQTIVLPGIDPQEPFVE